MNPQTGKMEPDPSKKPDGRDLFGNSPDFWTVRIVTISATSSTPTGIIGTFIKGFNTILIRYEEAKATFKNWSDYVLVTPISQTLLHEIGHALGCDDETEGVMKSPIQASEMLLPDFRKFLPSDILAIQAFSQVKN